MSAARGHVLGTAILILGLLGGKTMADVILFDFEGPFDFATVEGRDARVSAAGSPENTRLRIDFGHAQTWPGITLPAPDGKWDLSAYTYLQFDVTNVGDQSVQAMVRVDNPGANGQDYCVQTGVEVPPGETRVLRADLPHQLTDADGNVIELFGMRGYPHGTRGQSTFNATNVTQLLIFVAQPTRDYSIEIDNIRVGGAYTPPIATAAGFFPFIDAFGQYMHADWPGKTHSAEELIAHAQAERADLDAHPGPEEWDQWGGWAEGPTLEATGFFRVEKVNGKWWLVDPDGKLFFSHGVDCVGAWGDSTPLEDREHWYADLPGPDSALAAFYGTGHSIHYYYEGRTVRTFDYGAANLARKYGDDWWVRFADITHERLRSWGVNTIANWSEEGIYLQRRTPYVVSIWFGGRMLEGSEGYWGKFRDVFDPSFEQAIRESMAGQKDKTAGDPWCLGYFVDNEIAWGDDTSLATAALASPADQPAKPVFIEDLKAKYTDIARLNAVGRTEHASWEALLESTTPPDRARARDDLRAFYTKTAERYFDVIGAAVKEVAPNQLYLGCRFAWVNPLAAAAAVGRCDVVSYNLYQRSVEHFEMPDNQDVPLIIGEFHFGALDRGLFHTGLVACETQEERAEAYRSYVQGALAHPQFVGCHWFKYRDEATTGRALDAENYQIGFVDICDTPYPETIAAVREVGYGMYRLRYGE